MHPITLHFAYTQDGRKIHYRQAGHGPPLVLLNASPASSRVQIPLLEAWSGHFNVIALDTPGFGLSDPLAIANVEIGDLADALPEIVKPLPGDILLPKRHPSAFFGTALASYLIDLGVDTLVVTGCTTSGCVRASVVDAFSYNFRVQVPHDAVYDRGAATHAVNLFDMAQKYADVRSSTDIIDLLNPVPARTA